MSLAVFIQLVLNGLAMGVLYSLPALGVTLIWNSSGLFNFAQGDILALGGYLMLSLYGMLNVPFIPAFLIVLAVMGLFGYVLSRIYFYPMIEHRVSPLIILIGTVALSVFIRNLILVIWGSTPQTYTNPFGSQVFQIGELYLMPHVIWILIIAAVLLTLLQLFLRGTMVGTAMRAVAQNQTASWLMGIKNDRMIALTFMLSSAIAAVSGVLLSPIIPLTPSTGGIIAVKAMAAVVIGGLGSFAGALVGGISVGIAETIFAAIVNPAYRDVFVFIILILFLLFRPEGIFKAQVSEKI